MENTLDRECSIASSGGSTPEPPGPFCPKFHVSFTDNISKDGKSITYRIHVSQNDEIIQVIERDYENFEYLHHCVTTDQPYQGLIIPPLPCKLATDAQSAEAFTKKQMGKNSKTLFGDDFKRQSYELQIYLELLLSHPVLGKSPRLQEFLLSKDPPPKIKIRQGLVNKLSTSLETRKITYPDSDDFFHKERNWISKYLPAMDKFSSSFNKIIYSEIKFAYQLEETSVALKHQYFVESHSSKINSLNRVFHHIIDITKVWFTNDLEEKNSFKDTKISCVFDMWNRYIMSEGEMLLRRTALMIDYHACNRTLEKVKPNRKESAEIAKRSSEEAFEKCTDDARKEIKRFHQLRTNDCLGILNILANHEIIFASHSITLLSSALATIKSVTL